MCCIGLCLVTVCLRFPYADCLLVSCVLVLVWFGVVGLLIGVVYFVCLFCAFVLVYYCLHILSLLATIIICYNVDFAVAYCWLGLFV